MANREVFNSFTGVPTNMVNAAGGAAYKMTDRHALAQYAVTGFFSDTFYVQAESQLESTRGLIYKLRDDPAFLAKVAVYARIHGNMKDMPAFIVASLATIDSKLFRRVFPRVINNGKMLLTFAQIARSGMVGRKLNLSAGAVRKAIQKWFDDASCESIFNTIGSKPSIVDVMRMARPKPNTKEKAALFTYLRGGTMNPETLTLQFAASGKVLYTHQFEDLPQIVQQFEKFKSTKEGDVPKVDFRRLDALGLTTEHWQQIARNALWNMTKKNLNTFLRHGVFACDDLVSIVAERIANEELVAKARVFPYEIMTGWMQLRSNPEIPAPIINALEQAMEHAVKQIPSIYGKVVLAIDVSGSMKSPVTGNRKGSTCLARCVDVAGLMAAAFLRKNPDAVIVPFNGSPRPEFADRLSPEASIMQNAQAISNMGGGATDCGAAMAYINKYHADASTVIFVSDYESWVDVKRYKTTGLLTEWNVFLSKNKTARLVCMDLAPRGDSQVTEKHNILQVGGFSDACYTVVGDFLAGKHDDPNYWVSIVDSTNIDANVEPMNVLDAALEDSEEDGSGK